MPRYDLVKSLSGEFSVETLCAVLGLSRTAYYRYKRGHSYQPTSPKQDKKQLVARVFAAHKRRYGTGLAFQSANRSRASGARLPGGPPAGTDADESGWFTSHSAAAADRLSHLCRARPIVGMAKGIGRT